MFYNRKKIMAAVLALGLSVSSAAFAAQANSDDMVTGDINQDVGYSSTSIGDAMENSQTDTDSAQKWRQNQGQKTRTARAPAK